MVKPSTQLMVSSFVIDFDLCPAETAERMAARSDGTIREAMCPCPLNRG
jgi:hypothetical protein